MRLLATMTTASMGRVHHNAVAVSGTSLAVANGRSTTAMLRFLAAASNKSRLKTELTSAVTVKVPMLRTLGMIPRTQSRIASHGAWV